MNEFQNAYALSSMERRRDDPEIAQELAKNKFVLVEIVEQCCPFTDAILPSWKSFLGSFDSREAAEQEAATNQWREVDILPHPIPIRIYEPATDIPF